MPGEERRVLRSRVASAGPYEPPTAARCRNIHGKQLTGESEPPDKHGSSVMSVNLDRRPYRRMPRRGRDERSSRSATGVREYESPCRLFGSLGGRMPSPPGVQISTFGRLSASPRGAVGYVSGWFQLKARS
jgi:hypothetical protein